MLNIKLISHTNTKPIDLISHAAKICYQSTPPEWGKQIDVKNRLFSTGHHTTLQHFFFTFHIENITLGDIIFGLHMNHPFYNSDERSGRFCAKIYTDPNYEEIETYVKTHWPELDDDIRQDVINYTKKICQVYVDNFDQATDKAREFIQTERPNCNDKYIDMNAPKIAMEQLRVFIPLILPTGLDHTLNITALVAMYRAAWTPGLRLIMQKMVDEVLRVFPELEFLFNPGDQKQRDWAVAIENLDTAIIKTKPELKLLKMINDEDDLVIAEKADTHPVDLLHFMPETMNNSMIEIESEVEMSIIGMHQDHRHRTLRRTAPVFSGNFYLPPITASLNLEKQVQELFGEWKAMRKKIPDTLFMVLAPYGSMLKYRKIGSINAIAHEQEKRLCWCAQEEIYHTSRALRQQVEALKGSDYKMLKLFAPACYADGVCGEGVRYCGRKMEDKLEGNFFPKRKI